MNLLLNALTGIQGIISNQPIQIKTNNYLVKNGFPTLMGVSTISTIAHVQAFNDSTEYKNTDFTIDSVKRYKFYILSDKIQLINSQLEDLKNSYIVWNNAHYNPYEKEDWALNGWISVTTTLYNEGSKNV